MDDFRRRRVRGSILGMMALSLAFGCGGGGGGPTGPGGRGGCAFGEPPPNFPDRSATLTSSGAAGNSIVLRQGANCSDLLVLELFADTVADLAGVEYSIGFPSNALGIDNRRIGPFLTGNGSVQVASSGSVVNGTLQRPAGQPGASGSGQVALFAWVYQGATGTFNMTLQGRALDSNGDPIAGSTFAGGSVNISL